MTGRQQIPYVIEEDLPGVWSASAFIKPGVGLFERGSTPKAAVEELREALAEFFWEFDMIRVQTLDPTP
jgi:hypothetical protein